MKKDLTNIYAEWRAAGEDGEATFTWDCGEKSAREDFAEYADLEEISFEEMLKLETNYEA